MKGWTRFITLLLTVCLALGLCTTAGAEVMTLGVYFRGLAEREDGTTVQVPLTGSFRVTQGGIEKGILQAGVTTVTLDGSDPVTITPVAETIPAGWDLRNAAVTVNMADGGNVTVPILVPQLKDDYAAAAAETPEPAPETPEAPGEPTPETAEQSEEGGEDEPETQQPAPAATPEWHQTPVPENTPTPEPEVGILSSSDSTGTFHIKVFYDSNSNGDCSIYEKGVGGIPVYLISAGGETVTGGKTDEEGEITLPGLDPGAYRIRVSLPEEYGFNRKAKDVGLNKSFLDFFAGAEQESEPVSVSAGETVERGIGLLKGVVVDGVCWLDENADGVMDAGEPKIAGIRVTFSGQKNGLEFEAYSDENGYWRVVRLRAGYYDFSSYAPEGMMFTRYSKTGGKNRSVFTTEGRTKATKTLDLNDGRNQLDQNIGFAWSGSVTGMAFQDANYNGLYDEGEKPMPGVKVTAIKQNKDEEIAVAYSGEDGTYTLGGLRGNVYKIRAVLPDDGSNFTVAVDAPEGNHFVARDNRRENFLRDFSLGDGEKRTVNVGAIYYGSVSGTVYLDDDFSASRSGSEKVSQGVTVTLLDANGTSVGTKQTTAKGTYSFTGLTPGLYSLRMTAKQGYAFTRRGEGNVMINLNGGEGYSETFEVPLGEDVTGMDAGMIMPGTVKGAVFADRNDNGRRDGDEAGLAGVTVRLMSEEGEAFSALLTESGEFLFDAVMPGRYYLEYQLPEDGIFAREGGDSAISGENGVGRGEWFDFRTADQKEAPLCGALTLGRISGTFFRDHDGSGTMEAGDAPMEGLRLTLIPGRSDLEEMEAVSDANGAFELKNLHPDTYQMIIRLPEGLVTSRTAKVTLPADAGRANQEKTLQIAMGQRWESQEIGGVMPASLSGSAWLDENNNGLMDSGEATPAGLALTVTDEETGEVFETLYTAEDGTFGFAGMVPGSYAVSYQMDSDTDRPPEGDNTFLKEGTRLVMTGIALGEGDARNDLTLGMVKYTAMGGMVWIDRGSAVEPLPGAKVSLLGEDGGVLETQTTPETGVWRFSGLMPGTYRIQADLPEGTVAAEPDDERLETGLISVVRETSGRTGRTDPIPLKMGQDQLSLNIGSVLPGTIGDFCWLDLNGNGWQDGGELGIPHVRVELVRNGQTVAETETDQYGLYFFREVYPAVYTLKVTAPSQVKPTRKGGDIYLIDSSLEETEAETAFTEEFSVASDSTDFNIDLGYALRTPDAYPPGYGQQETMDWSKAYEDNPLKQ